MQGKFEGIIILSDLDGTLLCRDHTICKRNREKIEYFKQNGGYFTFNTGRNYLNIYKNIPDAHEVVNAPIVSCNGACLYDAQKREPVAEHFIDPEKAKGAIRIQKEKYPDVRAEMSSSTGVFAESYDSYVAMDFPNRNVTILPLDEMRCDNWYKVVFRGEPCDLVPLRDEVIERFGAEFEYCNSSPNYFEICPRGCSKGAMIPDLKRYCGINGKNMTLYAVGDYENDITMLRAADFSACPSNAMDEVKAICDVQLCSCDEGAIADLIEYIEERIGE